MDVALKLWGLWIVCLSCLAARAWDVLLTREFAAARAAQVGEIRYGLSLAFEEHAREFEGTARIDLQLRHADADLAIDFAGDVIEKMQLNQQPFTAYVFDTAKDTIRIPREHLAPGPVHLEIHYRAAYSQSGSGLHRYLDPEDGLEYLYTDFQPNKSHRVFPCFDQPDLRATFTLDVLAPATWEVVSNGPLLSSRRQGGRNRLTFQTTQPIAPYLFNLVLGAYAVWHDLAPVPMRILGRQSYARYINAKAIFQSTRKGMRFFQEYFGLPYPFAKYDQSFVPEFNVGAMENPGSVLMTEGLILGYDPAPVDVVYRDQIILHEMAHMWFGNLVTMRWWNDLWLNESFASYMEIVGLAALGHEDVWRVAAREKMPAYRADQRASTHPVIVSVPDTQAAATIFDAITYNKGMAVLHQLDHHLGSHVFRDGVRGYLRKHAWNNTDFGDFLAAMETAVGRDLDPWFHAWLHSAGVNTVAMTWRARRGRISKAAIRQLPGTGSGLIRPHAMLLGFFYLNEAGKVVLRHEVPVVLEGPLTHLPQLEGLDKPLFIQPNLRELAYARVQYDAVSLDGLFQNVHRIENVGYRAQAWRTLWEGLLNDEVDAVSFFDMAMIQIERSDEAQLVEDLVAKMKTVARDLLPETQAGPLREQLFQLARKRLASPRGLTQHQWFYLILAVAERPHHLDVLAQLFDGELTISGYAIGHDEKWELLSVLAACGAPGWEKRLAVLESESNAGLTETYGPLLEALRPDLVSKERVWRLITEEQATSLDYKRNLMEGFFSRRQPQLAQPFIDRYFVELAKAFHQKPWEYTHALVLHMFPYSGGKTTLEAARRFLANEEIPPSLRRLVLEPTEELELAVRLRNGNRKRPAIGQ